MSERNHVPWDKRPLTAMDFAITTTIGVFVCLLGAAGLFFLFRDGGDQGTPPPQPQAADQVAPETEAQPTLQPTTETLVQDTGAAGRGDELFQEKCAGCHTIGGGPTVGPDLEGVVAERDRQWLMEWIQNPDQMLAQGDPLATEMLAEWNDLAMPDLDITQDQAADLLAYIEVESGGAPEVQTAEGSEPVEVESTQAPPVVSIEGDPEIGEGLFVGRVALTNGGPACISCHEFSGLGALGGGTLGPALTGVADRLGPQGLTSSLGSLPFPSMQPVYDERQLTEVEIAHLAAFFTHSGQEASAAKDYTFVLIGIAGLAVFAPITHLIWRNRFKGVRKQLVGR